MTLEAETDPEFGNGEDTDPSATSPALSWRLYKRGMVNG
jgi:hypothetical protein